MTDYGKGNILGAASVLPATTGAGLLITQNADPLIVGALFVISAVSLVVLAASISRYLVNSKRG